jgi:hypothetical protein
MCLVAIACGDSGGQDVTGDPTATSGVGAPTGAAAGATMDAAGDGAGAAPQAPTGAAPAPAESGTGGAGAMAPADTAGAQDAEPAADAEGGEDVPPGGIPYAFDECDIDTGYAGDEYCILPPPPDKGFQLRVGPDDYDNPDPRYILQPGEESTDDFAVTSANGEDIFFYFRQYRMRPGAHHMIISESGSNAFGIGGGRRIGTANLSADSPEHGIVAPENESVGVPLSANSPLNVSLHSINVTDEPILREIWVNFWYQDPDKVTEPAEQLFKVGSATFAIQPREDTVLGPYSCDISGEGRMLWFYGHRHANNVRFSAWRVRGDERLLFYEGYNWEEVLLLEYSSLVQNPAPDPANHIEGGHSGILDLRDGDRLEWECHVINQQDSVLRFTNETYLGEMCIMDGEMVGVNCNGGGF